MEKRSLNTAVAVANVIVIGAGLEYSRSWCLNTAVAVANVI